MYDPMQDIEAKVIGINVVQGQQKEDGSQSLGINLKCEFLNGPAAGKKYDHILWLHTEDTERISKQAYMAVYGYDRSREAEFNSMAAEKDWFIDGDQKLCGNGWTELVGRAFRVNVDVKPNKQTGEPQNQFIYFPLN